MALFRGKWSGSAGLRTFHIAVTTLLLMIIWPATSASNSITFTKGQAIIGGSLISVEIAKTESQQKIGLSNRNLNKKNYFMVFEFTQPKKVNFWMKKTKIDLSLAFINSSYLIDEIVDMKANSLSPKTSKSDDVLYAVEVPKGFFKQNNIKVGDYFQLIK
jgi:uncharacterized membrane protein (UPF0127 family)